jgi:hypothetical protein
MPRISGISRMLGDRGAAFARSTAAAACSFVIYAFSGGKMRGPFTSAKELTEGKAQWRDAGELPGSRMTARSRPLRLPVQLVLGGWAFIF